MDESVEDRLRHVTAARQKEGAAVEDRYLEASKKRLMKIVFRKVMTAFIGAIAKMEAHFGASLWGHGKTEDECTAEELVWRAIWDECRTDILNNGNNQMRALEAEFQLYTIHWDRYTVRLTPPEKKEEE